MRLPEMDGVLHLKEGKRSWKKHYFALRASGVYVNPKGKNKVGALTPMHSLGDGLTDLMDGWGDWWGEGCMGGFDKLMHD